MMQCYLCGSKEFRKLDGTVRDAPTISILECKNCALVFLDKTEHLGPKHYQSSGMFGGSVPPIPEMLVKTEKDDIRRFEDLYSSILGRKVLDFGSGCGGFLHKIKPYAKFSMGIELEERVHEYWGDKLLLGCDIESGKNFAPFDLITAFHVIEHLKNPREVLRELSSLLAVGGRMVIEVPNSADALINLYKSPHFKSFTYWSQHLYLFNSSNLKSLINQAGLNITAIKQYQRYPLVNHLHWLAKGFPGGEGEWPFLNDPALNKLYANALASVGSCDTLIAYMEKR